MIQAGSLRIRFSLLATVLAMALLATGCGTKPEAQPANTGVSAGSNSEGYVVKHAMDETRIPKTPERIVVLTNEATEALLALGIKPVGAVNSWVSGTSKSPTSGRKPVTS